MSVTAVTTNHNILNKNDTGDHFDVDAVRHDFPALGREMNDKELVYLDTAASALKSKAVIQAMTQLMEGPYSNIHRGLYEMSQTTTLLYEGARSKVANFINANSENEIVFTRNGTEAINLLARTWGLQNLQEGDRIILTELEHHANIVPWHMLREELGIILEFAKIDELGNFDLEDFKAKLELPNVKLASFAHISNALGTVLPVKEMVSLAKSKGITTIIDGCQGIMHGSVDVQDLGCDFYIFSSHKLYGPSGIGVLYGRYEMLNALPPYQGGGDMIETVDYDKITYAEAPARFEAGTPAIIEAVGLGASIDYLSSLGMDNIEAHEEEIYSHLLDEMSKIDRVKLISQASSRKSVVSFLINGAHPSDVATLLDKQGVAVRVGHHCAEPLMKRLGLENGTIRASVGIYTSKQDITRFIEALNKTIRFL
ncbi:MAG: cysteine desulfurase [Rickettsiales bacterium]|nr:cysteine desulfurase [Rickettsiales bacterium]